MILDNALVIGCGQGGGNIVAAGHPLFRRAIYINTNENDMVGLPADFGTENRWGAKYCLSLTSGTGKDPAQGARALEKEKDQVFEWIKAHAEEAKFILVVVSLGGGSGTGVCRGVIGMALEMGKPVGVICTLPENRKDVLSAKNAIEVFRDLYAYATAGKIAPLIPIKNQMLIDSVDATYRNRWKRVNQKIWKVFSTLDGLSNQGPSAGNESILDPMDLARTWTTGRGCASVAAFPIVYGGGTFEVGGDFDQAVFFDGFDSKSAQIVAYAVVAPKRFYNMKRFTKILDGLDEQIKDKVGDMIFHGVYNSEDDDGDVAKVYALFNGLQIPQTWVKEQIQEVAKGISSVRKKQSRIGGDIDIDMSAGDDAFSSGAFDQLSGGD